MSKNIVVAIVVLIVLIALILLFTGDRKELTRVEPAPLAPDNEPEIISATGVVARIDLAGGFFGILGDDGIEYYPINLSEDFQSDGLAVQFRGRKVEGFIGIHMWGLPIEIIEVTPMAGVENEPEAEVVE